MSQRVQWTIAVATFLLAMIVLAAPATNSKWVGPWVPVLGGLGRFRTTIYYGPWKCRAAFISDCRNQCASEQHSFMGCVWVADIKKHYEGEYFIKKGVTHIAVTHCCCDVPKLDKAEVAKQRKEWERIRDNYRKEWSDEFGDWPKSGDKSWPGHHVHDLKRRGDPAGWVIPVPGDVHTILNSVYPRCYDGQDGWDLPGPEWPYLRDEGD